VPLPVHPNIENIAYLRAKRDKLGHELVLDADVLGAVP
jgi:GTP cyclohydrolase II